MNRQYLIAKSFYFILSMLVDIYKNNNIAYSSKFIFEVEDFIGDLDKEIKRTLDGDTRI